MAVVWAIQPEGRGRLAPSPRWREGRGDGWDVGLDAEMARRAALQHREGPRQAGRSMSKKKGKPVRGQGGDITALFSAAPGLLATPWRVASSQLDVDGHRIDIQLECDAQRLTCEVGRHRPSTGGRDGLVCQAMSSPHDTRLGPPPPARTGLRCTLRGPPPRRCRPGPLLVHGGAGNRSPHRCSFRAPPGPGCAQPAQGKWQSHISLRGKGDTAGLLMSDVPPAFRTGGTPPKRPLPPRQPIFKEGRRSCSSRASGCRPPRCCGPRPGAGDSRSPLRADGAGPAGRTTAGRTAAGHRSPGRHRT
jgi:hypothetical protein